MIDGNGSVTNDRVFAIFQCVANDYNGMSQHCSRGNVVVSISDVTIKNGKRSYTSFNSNAVGGAIQNNGNLALTNVTISTSSANSSTGAAYGGAINSAATLNLTNGTISNNQVTTVSGLASGGGILGASTMSNCTISGNVAHDVGGGLFGDGAIVNSTISGNTAASGGGVYGSPTYRKHD